MAPKARMRQANKINESKVTKRGKIPTTLVIQFFNNQLNPFSYAYSLELGLEYNTQLKITLIGQRLLNTDPNGEFGLLVARLIIAYRF